MRRASLKHDPWAGWRRPGIAGLLAVLSLAGPIPVAQPDTLTVCGNGCDYISLQAAVNAASPGDTLRVAAGAYPGNLIIDKTLTVHGAGAGQTSIVGGAPVITIPPGAAVTLDGVTVAGGQYENPVGGELYTGGGASSTRVC